MTATLLAAASVDANAEERGSGEFFDSSGDEKRPPCFAADVN
jgi:hypothetical protein